MAGLALPREEQHRLRVLVLQTRQRLVVQGRRVEGQLARRMRVEPHPYLVSQAARLVRSARDERGRQPGHVIGGQHVGLREHEPVDRIIRGTGPVDQLLGHIGVGPERQDRGDSAHGQPDLRGQAGPLGERVQMLGGIGAEPAALGRRTRLDRDDLLD